MTFATSYDKVASMSAEKPTGLEGSSRLIKPELHIAKVEISEERRGIPLGDFNSVSAALHTFAHGRSPGSRTTQNKLLDDTISTYGDEGFLTYFQIASQVDQDAFLNDMLKQAEPAVKRRGHWERNYDGIIDAFGTSFFKTFVEITRLPYRADSYLLELCAAGRRTVEEELAQTLGVERGLKNKQVKVTFEPNGDNFRIDFDQIAQRLQRFYGELAPEPTNVKQRWIEVIKGKRPALTGEGMLRAMLPAYEEKSFSPIVEMFWVPLQKPRQFILGVADGSEVSYELSVGSRYKWMTERKKKELWHTEGTVLSGPLNKSYVVEGELNPPSISFTIQRYNMGRLDYIPTIDPESKARMNELATKVAECFQ